MKSSEDNIIKLRLNIAKHDRSYYVLSKPEISDQEYDKLYKDLVELEKNNPEFDDPNSPTKRIGSSLGSSDIVKYNHTQKMLSLDNTYDQDELSGFDKRVKKSLGHSGFNYSAELKIDGVAASLWYEDGKLMRALTRGDGERGDDITHNVRTIRSVPLKLNTESPPKFVEIRGEIYMSRTVFEELNKEKEEAGEDLFANPRNAASGSIKQLNPKEVSRRKLDFFCHSIGKIDGYDAKFHSEFLKQVKDWGIAVVQSRICKNIKEVWTLIEAVDDRRKKLNYDTDGIVIKVDDLSLQKKIGIGSRSPKWGIAYKYQAERAETTLLNIDIQIGKTGILSPVARLKPVHLAGSTIENATLFNQKNIDDKDIRIGDQVLIEKGGEIIPQVIMVLKEKRTGKENKFTIPSECPSCKSKASKKINVDGKESAAIFCLNPNCPAQSFEKIKYFVSKKCMDIDGVGEAVIEKLIDNNLISNAADLYTLTKEDFLTLDGCKDRSATKYIKAIEKSKEQDLAKLLTSLNIPLVGKTLGEVFSKHFQTLKAFVNSKQSELEDIEGVGSSMAASVVKYFKNEDNRNFVRQLVKTGINMSSKKKKISNPLFEGKKFVLTGTLDGYSRDEASERIKERGGKTSGSVSKNTDFVLAGENAGSKLEKAKKLGVKILSQSDFERMLV